MYQGRHYGGAYLGNGYLGSGPKGEALSAETKAKISEALRMNHAKKLADINIARQMQAELEGKKNVRLLKKIPRAHKNKAYKDPAKAELRNARIKAIDDLRERYFEEYGIYPKRGLKYGKANANLIHMIDHPENIADRSISMQDAMQLYSEKMPNKKRIPKYYIHNKTKHLLDPYGLANRALGHGQTGGSEAMRRRMAYVRSFR
jgi:hypothetical protein